MLLLLSFLFLYLHAIHVVVVIVWNDFLPSNVKFRQEVCQRTDWNELFFSPENCPRRTNFSDEDNYLPQQLPQPRFFFLELEKIQ